MILYKKAQYGRQVGAANATELQNNDSLGTASGNSAWKAKGFGARDTSFSVTGDQMVDGKRQFQMAQTSGTPGQSMSAADSTAARSQAITEYQRQNPTSTNTAPPPSKYQGLPPESAGYSAWKTKQAEAAKPKRKNLGSFSF